MKAVLSSFGSSGDFNPCLGLGRALRRAGVDVLFLSNPYYETIITEAGLRFVPAGDYFDVFKEIRDNPAYLNKRKGPPAVWKMVLRTVPVMYRAMSELIETEKPDLIACHLLEFGGMLAAAHHGIAYATLTPTPMGWFNARYPSYVNFYRLPRWLRCTQGRLGQWIFKLAFKYNLIPLCRKEGIEPAFESVNQVFGKARLNLGLWSPLLRGRVDGDPPRSAICGFVRDAHIRDWPDVPEAIARLFAGSKRPVVVGLGSTAALHGDRIYEHAVRACRDLDWPCLLIGRDLARYANPDRHILTADFAPYGWVFPRAGLVIHHGGVNTTAETLRAGVPALIIPHGYDQFDNAIRTQLMGLSRRLKISHIDASVLTATIRRLLDDRVMLQRARVFADQLRAAPDGGAVAADQLIQAIGDTEAR